MKTPNRHRFADFSAAESPLDPDNIRIRRPVPSSSFSIFRVSFFTNLTSSYSPVCTCPYRNAKKIRFFPSVSAHSFVQNTDAEKTDFLLHFSLCVDSSVLVPGLVYAEFVIIARQNHVQQDSCDGCNGKCSQGDGRSADR